MRALVTDGDERAALAITRSLGRRGISVLVGEQRPVSLASSSRFCTKHVTYPSPYREREDFQRFLIDVVEREKVDVVVPVTDVTTSSIALNREALGRRAAIAAPPFHAFDMVTDKSNLLQAAAGCGIPIPRTLFVDGAAGLRELVGRVTYPAVVKPARSRVLTGDGWLATSVHYAHGEADLWSLYQQHDYLASYPSLIQQRIVGPGVGIFVLFDRGELLTAFAHKRLREKPPSGGVSVLCESVPVDPELRADAVRLLGPLGWHGVAMLEYKRDHRTGERFLIEVNGRFWGSLQLAVTAGVDFPYLTYQLALGHGVDVPDAYRVGVRNRWLLGDLDHLLSRLFGSRASLGLPDAAPSRLRTLVEFVTSTKPGVSDQTVSVGDPGPFRYELRQYAQGLTASLGSRLRGRAGQAAGLGLARPSVPAER